MELLYFSLKQFMETPVQEKLNIWDVGALAIQAQKTRYTYGVKLLVEL